MTQGFLQSLSLPRQGNFKFSGLGIRVFRFRWLRSEQRFLKTLAVYTHLIILLKKQRQGKSEFAA